MRVFVAGASGAIGRRLLPLLIAGGHHVTGHTTTPVKADLIRRTGSEAVVADGLDPAAMRSIVLAAKPDVIVHEMTSLAGATDLRNFDSVFAQSNRLRTEGLDILLAAARESGVSRIVVQSYCGWPYARTGGPIKSEDDPLDSDPPRRQRQTLRAIIRLESTVAQAQDIAGVVLRYGALYGPGIGMLDSWVRNQISRRRMPLIGAADGWWSFLHVDDAAAATAIAVGHSATGLFNIVDDEPAPVREWLPALASFLGARSPGRVPKWLARLLAGEVITTMMTEMRAGSNAKAAGRLGWRPAYASWRQGFVEALA
jgi:nucleoside-diphosphate-sugar epimerase